MEHVTRKELNKILNGSLTVRFCPKCRAGSPQITMLLNIYGRNGLKIECQHCGYSTELQGIRAQIEDETRFATPITPKSIVKSIYKAVTSWNQKQPFPEVAANE